MTDQCTFDATLRNVELLGEAATHVPESVREMHPAIPWRQIIGTRNRVAHGYLGIDDDVWSSASASGRDNLVASAHADVLDGYAETGGSGQASVGG